MRSRSLLAAVLMAGAAGAFPSSAPAIVFTRQPWLSLLTPTSVLIAWQTDLPSDGKVLYAAEPPDWAETAETDVVPDHVVALAGR